MRASAVVVKDKMADPGESDYVKLMKKNQQMEEDRKIERIVELRKWRKEQRQLISERARSGADDCLPAFVAYRPTKNI